MTCPGCGTEAQPGQKFCAECGTALALACPSCGAPHQQGQKFCAECGTALVTDRHKASSPDTSGAGVTAAAPAAERRLVSVLFADLVGFTTASEGRDAEETRELLSRYFDVSRSVIERYGGTVEKFIGDAVMPSGGRRSQPRTTPSAPCARPSSSSPRSPTSTPRCRRVPESSPARLP